MICSNCKCIVSDRSISCAYCGKRFLYSTVDQNENHQVFSGIYRKQISYNSNLYNDCSNKIKDFFEDNIYLIMLAIIDITILTINYGLLLL